MADTKLSALLSSSAPCNFYYGIDASNNSRKFVGPGIYNVKDYGAVGDGFTDDASAIQAAVDAATTASAPGGIIFFPAGTYIVNSAITFSATSWAKLRIIGSGGGGQFGGTMLSTSNPIYIFYCHNTTGQGGNRPYESVEHITFINTHDPGVHGTITSSELAGGGFGCIYSTAGTSMYYRSCGFQLGVGGGIAMYDNTQSCSISSCVFTGGYSGTHAEDSYGLFLSSGTVRDCQFTALGVAISAVAAGSAGVIIEDLDIEVNGCAIRVGLTPISLWDSFSNATYGPGGSQAASCIILNCGFESNGDTDGSSNAGGASVGAVIDLFYAASVHVEGCVIAQFSIDQTNGIAINNISSGSLKGITTRGSGGKGFTTAAINFTNANDFYCYGCFADNPIGSAWVLPTSGHWGGSACGIRFEHCNTDGAVLFADLPPTPGVFGAQMVCSNSSTATFGTVIGGTGATKVVARWDGSNWVVA